jgi:hypothetical protein
MLVGFKERILNPGKGCWTPEMLQGPRKDDKPQKRMLDPRKGFLTPEKDDGFQKMMLKPRKACRTS